MVREAIESNVAVDGSLAERLRQRNGLTVAQLEHENLAEFLELGVPKLIAKVLMDEHWYIEPSPGVVEFRFTRSGNPPYDIVHLAMNVGRQSPRSEDRSLDTVPPAVGIAYETVARKLFETPALLVTNDLACTAELRESLAEIKDRRRLF